MTIDPWPHTHPGAIGPCIVPDCPWCLPSAAWPTMPGYELRWPYPLPPAVPPGAPPWVYNGFKTKPRIRVKACREVVA